MTQVYPYKSDTSLVGYWKLDETSGTLVDSSGNGNNGTAYGSPTYGAKGVHGRCLKFDGVDDYVNAGNGASLNITDAITISAWVNTKDGENFIVSKNSNWNDANSFQYDIELIGSKIRWTQSSPTTLSNTAAPNNTWVHVAVTINNSNNGIYYLNGVADGTFASNARTYHPVSVLIGARRTVDSNTISSFFNGSIDEVRIYNRALSADEIYKHYLYGKTNKLTII